MAWSVEISARADKDLSRIDQEQRKRIFRFLHGRVALLDNPRLLGKQMSGEAYRDLWIYRVGNYRLLCSFQEEALVVLVTRIGHRREVYDRLSF